MTEKLYFNNLTEEDFLHPSDLLALKAVKAAKGLDTIANWLLKMSYEKIQRIVLMGNSIKATPTSYKKLFDMAHECSNILNMPVPELYIAQSPAPNAFAIGSNSPIISLNSSLIDLMDDEELLCIIAHEMGHIKAKHILYRTIAAVLSQSMTILGPLKLVVDKAVSLSLLNWNRKSELSADRASLLVGQDVEVIISVLMKLSGAKKDHVDVNDFINQSKEYRRLENTISGKAYKLFINLHGSHPFAVMRVNEIIEWSESDEYKKILSTGSKQPKYLSLPESEKIRDLDVKAHGNGKVNISWSPSNTFGIAGYKIFRKFNEDESEEIKQVSSNSQSYTDIINQPGMYSYYVSAVTHTNHLIGKSDISQFEITKIDEQDNAVKFVSWLKTKKEAASSKINMGIASLNLNPDKTDNKKDR